MTYDNTEKSPLGRPVELYEFTQGGEFTRYTSAPNSQFIGATEFAPLAALRRGQLVVSSEGTSGEISVTMPSSEPIPAQFRGTIPSNLPSLTIFRKHLNDPGDEVITWFKGTVINCAFREKLATLVAQTDDYLFTRPIPRAVYSGMCNHQLYDASCKIPRADYDFPATTIAAVDSTGTVITITGLRAAAQAIATTLGLSLSAQEIDDFWLRGYIETTVSPPELRMISTSDVGGDPDTVSVHIPFRVATVGSSINVYAGCPHSIDFCNRKFLNAVNFGGFPQVPTNNPFQIDLESGRANGNTVEPKPFRTGSGFF